MAQQKHRGKPNFKSFASVTGGGKKKEKVKKVDHAKVSRRAKEKDGVNSQPPSMFSSGYCASQCGHCISCKIAKGDEENRRRIEGSQELSHYDYRRRYFW